MNGLRRFVEVICIAEEDKATYAGTPITMPIAASTVFPQPRPNALYNAGEKRGNPKAKSERRQKVAASPSILVSE